MCRFSPALRDPNIASASSTKTMLGYSFRAREDGSDDLFIFSMALLPQLGCRDGEHCEPGLLRHALGQQRLSCSMRAIKNGSSGIVAFEHTVSEGFWLRQRQRCNVLKPASRWSLRFILMSIAFTNRLSSSPYDCCRPC